MTNWLTGFAASGNEKIYWECSGDGVPVVICHGAGSGHLSFYKQVVGMASEDIQVITWDQRGYGNSTLASGTFGIGLAVEDLTNVLLAAGLEHDAKVHLVGQAMGALVAASWAIANPDRTRSLAIWDGPFNVGNAGRDLIWDLDPADQGVQSTLVNRQVGKCRSVGAEFLKCDKEGTFLYQSLQVLGNARPSYSEAFQAAQSAEPVQIAQLAALDVPVLIGRGEFDHVADPKAYAQLAALIPRAEIVILPNSGHSPYFEVPEAWNTEMLRHIENAEKSAGAGSPGRSA